MNKKDIEKMLQGIDDCFLVEAQTEICRRKTTSFQRIAAMIVLMIICGIGFSAAVNASFSLKGLLEGIFQGTVSTQTISYDSDMMVAGTNECFIYEYHTKNDQEVVDQVYKIINSGLKKIECKSFSGFYDEEPFSFEYSSQHNEIFAYNLQGSIEEVFFPCNKNKAYASLMHVEDDKVKKACVVELDLKNGTTRKLSDDHMICNFTMSPEGDYLLCNHRSAGYWSIFDLAKHEERKIDPKLISDCLMDEICFQDENHILAPGDTYLKDGVEYTKENLINLDRMSVEETYQDYGDIKLRWNYMIENDTLTITDIMDGQSFAVEGITDDYYLADTQGNCSLFMDRSGNGAAYLVNLEEKKYKEITLPDELKASLNMHLMNNQKNMLFYYEGVAYVVDLSAF